MAHEIDTNPLEVGDVVILNSGGPPMTVVGRPAGDVATVWFVPSGQPLSGKFDKRVVRKLGEAKPTLKLRPGPDEENKKPSQIVT